MSIDITVLDAEDLFQILDVDGSGSISLTEFIEGFSRVKGPRAAQPSSGPTRFVEGVEVTW